MRISMGSARLQFAAVTAVASLALAGCASAATSSTDGQSSAGAAASASSSVRQSGPSAGPASGSGAAGNAPSGSARSSSPSAGGSGLPPEVIGATFVATQVTGKYSMVPGSTISLTLEKGTLAARAGCNNMFGPYTVAGDVLTASKMGSTMMACDPALMQQDTWLSGFLASGPTWTYSGGTLQLSNGTDTMQLTEALTGAGAVPGVGWKLVGLIAGSTVSSVDPSLSPWIEFDGKTVTIDTSCNSGGGNAEIGDTTITFGPLAVTTRGCEPPSSDVDKAMTSVLQGVTNYTVADDASAVLLVIMSEAGSEGLQFQADPCVGTPPLGTSAAASSAVGSSPVGSAVVPSGG